MTPFEAIIALFCLGLGILAAGLLLIAYKLHRWVSAW
jgi:hypothetical protein